MTDQKASLDMMRDLQKPEEDFSRITYEDIVQQTSFAAKIGAVTDAARQLPMKKTL